MGGSASGRALVGSSSPPSPSNTAVPWTCFSCYRGSPPATGGASPTKRKKKPIPTATLAWSPLLTRQPQVRNQKLSSCCQRDPPRAAARRVQALAADAGGAALHFSSPLTGEEAEHISREDGKQSSQTHLPFPPSSLAPAPAAPTSQRAVHWPQPPGRACPRRCSGKGANVVFPPGPASVTAAPLCACCGIRLSCSHGVASHRSRLISHTCWWPGAFR